MALRLPRDEAEIIQDILTKYRDSEEEAQKLQELLYTIAQLVPSNKRANAIQYDDPLVQKYDKIEERLIELRVPYTSPFYGSNNATPSEGDDFSLFNPSPRAPPPPSHQQPPPSYQSHPSQPRHRRAGTPPRPKPQPPPPPAPRPPLPAPPPPPPPPASMPSASKPVTQPTSWGNFFRGCVGGLCRTIVCPICKQSVFKKNISGHFLYHHGVGKHNLSYWLGQVSPEGGTRRRRKSKKTKHRKTIRKQ